MLKRHTLEWQILLPYRAHKETSDIPLASILVVMNLISKHGCLRDVMLICFPKLNGICLWALIPLGQQKIQYQSLLGL